MNEPARPKPSRLGWLIDKSLNFDRFAPVLLAGHATTPYYLYEKNHHYYSTYPLAQPILLTPLYIPLCAAIDAARWTAGDLILLARVMEKLMAGLLAAASVAFFFVLLDRLTIRRNAILLSAAFGFGTTTWAISSQALWQHSGGELLLLTLVALERWAAHQNSQKYLWLAGAWAGLALMVRPTDGLLACIVILALLRRRAIGALGAFLVLVSFIYTWWGGQCWGPRYLTEIMPFLTLLILPALDAVMASAWQRAIIVCLLVYAVGVQSVGVFCYPNGLWDTTPISADNHPERFWDWRDNPIRRTIGGGPILQPHRIVLEGALHGKAAAIHKMREAGYKGF